MNRTILIVLFSVGILLTTACQRETNPLSLPVSSSRIALTPAENKAVQATNTFGFTLFKQIVAEKPDSNIFFSPFSISMALSMALNGANGQTFETMRTVLGFDGLSQDSINFIFDNLYRQLQQLDPGITFHIANSIWYDHTFKVAKHFLNVTQHYFHAQIQSLNFADPSAVWQINHWVDQKTDHKITKILDRIARDEVLFLINALYFKGLWHYEFNPKATENAPFYSEPGKQITCKMMQGTMPFRAAFKPEYTAAQLTYGNDMFRMALIMPQNLNTFLESFTKDRWLFLLNECKPDSGLLNLPKFKFSFGLNLNHILKAMGMGLAFDPSQADFSRLTPTRGIYISRVDHKAFINVYESGTEAAAVTSVGFGRTSVPQPKIVFNRPFIFVIYEESSGSILFMGLVHQPVLE